ncbi:hypothetical protein ACIRYZ_40290 [Kitasatospora sp. NPDC101155]|uniref:hypothetical protein n=1 Tax=Kitasatospora sp. NPDC101155 TaxID=3364097 RepID=UPI00381AA13D
MRRTTLSLLAVGLLAATAACSSSSSTASPAAATTAPAAGTAAAPAASASPKQAQPAATQDAAAIAAKIQKAVPTAKTIKALTADNDPNHLLGKPHQYTSAARIVDTRTDSTTEGIDSGAVVEVFANEADAKARHDYIDAIGKAQPIFAEQDFLHGPVLVRVAKALTAAQAAEYDKAAG